MPAIVFPLVESSDAGGRVIAVFADQEQAMDVARSHASHRARRCLDQDAATWPTEHVREDVYGVLIQPSLGETDVFVVHTPSGERDSLRWNVRPAEVVKP